jgi:hypothetical protein
MLPGLPRRREFNSLAPVELFIYRAEYAQKFPPKAQLTPLVVFLKGEWPMGSGLLTFPAAR